VDTGTYGADLHDDWIEAVSVQGDAATQGVVRGMLDELEVTGASSPINVATGWAIVKGKLVKNTSNVSVNIPTPASSPRIDRIVVQVDFTSSPVSASIVRVAGTEATVPSVPALDQVDGTIWQVPLAQAMVTTGGVVTIADDRRYLGHGHVDTDSIQDAAVTRAKLSAASGMSVIGRSASSSGQPADIAASADGQVLRRSGGALGFGTVTTNGIADGAVTAAKLAGTATGFVKGMILPFSGTFDGHFPIDPNTAAADTRWHLCNGDTQNGVQTPNLRDKFVLGAGSTYPAGTSGGSATKNLSHTHGVGTYVTDAHTHSVSLQTAQGTSGAQLPAGGGSMYENIVNHTHGVGGKTGGAQPGLTGSSASGGSATQDIMPPYYALAYICYVGA